MIALISETLHNIKIVGDVDKSDIDEYCTLRIFVENRVGLVALEINIKIECQISQR